MAAEINIDKIKFHTISKEDLILSLDRLTRFKYPEIKYYRVFSELLCRYLTEPKLSKNTILSLDAGVIKALIEKIWNTSVAQYLPERKSFDLRLNNLLASETNTCYVMSDSIKELIDVKIDIEGVIEIASKNDELPINLKRLCVLKNCNIDSVEARNLHGLRFPVEKVVLCEGATEEILLPKFAKLFGYDFDKNGVKIISAGGKNKVAKFYFEFKEELRIPVFVLLDADAVETEAVISPVLRDCDYIYLIKHGEFEDIFSINLIKRTINNIYKNICECCVSDFKFNQPMTKTLTDFYRIHNLGDYQKADFAKQLASNLKYDTDLTDEIKTIISAIKFLI